VHIAVFIANADSARAESVRTKAIACLIIEVCRVIGIKAPVRVLATVGPVHQIADIEIAVPEPGRRDRWCDISARTPD
jgi:hypothetical protein